MFDRIGVAEKQMLLRTVKDMKVWRATILKGKSTQKKQ